MPDGHEVIEDIMLENLKIVQDRRYYRFTSDSVLLSRFASCKKNEEVADFCAGVGIVSLNYYGLHKDFVKSVTLFELQDELVSLAEKTIDLNGLQSIFTIQKGRLQDAGKEYNGRFSLILCNPPYKKANSGEQGLSRHMAVCRHECEITLNEIVVSAARMLKPGGRFCICQRIERLTDLIYALRANKLEPYDMVMVSAKDSDAPYLFIVESMKDKKPQLKIRNQILNGH